MITETFLLLSSVLPELDLGSAISSDAGIASSIAIILGAVFVVFQLRNDRQMIEATIKQANSSAEQARLSTEQLKQNYELATVDLVTTIYEQANGLEIQNSWLTVLNNKITSYEEFCALPESKQLAFYQIASLFESLGLLVDRGYVKPELIDDMFATQLAWDQTKPFVFGMRKAHATEDYYYFFEKLQKRLLNLQQRSESPDGREN
jgi:hypothetical protein